MPFILIIIGSLLLISAVRNTYGDLATALEADLPPYAKWALAIVGTGSLGYIPGMREISRWLLALVIVVIVLKNYQAILTGFTSLESLPAASTAAATPAATVTASSGSPVTSAEITGTSTTAIAANNVAGSINAAGIPPTIANPVGAFDPAAFLTEFEAGIGGFGGAA
jgi:hypothetical protein